MGPAVRAAPLGGDQRAVRVLPGLAVEPRRPQRRAEGGAPGRGVADEPGARRARRGGGEPGARAARRRGPAAPQLPQPDRLAAGVRHRSAGHVQRVPADGQVPGLRGAVGAVPADPRAADRVARGDLRRRGVRRPAVRRRRRPDRVLHRGPRRPGGGGIPHRGLVRLRTGLLPRPRDPASPRPLLHAGRRPGRDPRRHHQRDDGPAPLARRGSDRPADVPSPSR
jgi:hypothetical protein